MACKSQQLELAYCDISRTHDDLNRSEALLQGILQAAPSGIAMIRHQRLEWINHALLRIIGGTEEDLVGQAVERLFADTGACRTALEHAWAHLDGEELKSVTSRWRRADGSLVDVLLSFSALCPEDPEAGIIIAGIDLGNYPGEIGTEDSTLQ